MGSGASTPWHLQAPHIFQAPPPCLHLLALPKLALVVLVANKGDWNMVFQGPLSPCLWMGGYPTPRGHHDFGEPFPYACAFLHENPSWDCCKRNQKHWVVLMFIGDAHSLGSFKSDKPYLQPWSHLSRNPQGSRLGTKVDQHGSAKQTCRFWF